MLAATWEGGEGTGGAGTSMARTDFKDIAPEEIPLAVELARKMSSRLAKVISRRYRMTRKIKKLNFRQTLRQNVNYGGWGWKVMLNG